MRSTCRIALRTLLLVGAIRVPLAPLSSQAQPPQQLTPKQFQADPAQILASFPNGGAEMISLLRELTLADPADLPLIIGLLPKANDAQGTAIGTGLGQAALASVKTNQAYAAQIQQAVVEKSGAGAGGNGLGSSQPKIGTAVTTVDEVSGVTDRGTGPVATGSHVYLNEVVKTGVSGKAQMLFADH